MTEITHDQRAAAAAYLEGPGENPDDYSQSDYDECIVERSTWEWLVLTDEEADEKVAESIRESVWAFNSDFMAEQTGFDEEIFTAIQGNQRAESNNDAMLALIEKGESGFDGFVEAAVSADGRAHHLSTYDGRELEVDAGDYEFVMDDPEFDPLDEQGNELTDIPQVRVTITIDAKLYVYRIA